MKKADRNALLALPVIILLGIGIAIAGSYGGTVVFGIPLFALAVGLAFLIQWLVFIPAKVGSSWLNRDSKAGLMPLTAIWGIS